MPELKSTFLELQDNVTQSATVLMLSETWLSNEDAIDIHNFTVITKIKSENERAGGVTISQKISDFTNIITPNLEIQTRNVQFSTITSSDIGN